MGKEKELMEIACMLDFPEVLDNLSGDPYNLSKLKRITHSTKYIILGRGVIKSEYFNISDDIQKLEAFNGYFIPISSEDDLKALEDRIKNEDIEAKRQKELSEDELKEKIKQAIEEQVPEKTEEEKREIFDLVIEASVKKSEVETDYWAIFDIIRNATKTREILNIKMKEKINKNDFPTNKRKNKEEKNENTNK